MVQMLKEKIQRYTLDVSVLGFDVEKVYVLK